MTFRTNLVRALLKNPSLNAFCIDGNLYTYGKLAQTISDIRRVINFRIDPAEKLIGLIANDDLETYASIIALWLEGHGYVPIDPNAPHERNNLILDQVGLCHILNSQETYKKEGVILLCTSRLPKKEIILTPKEITDDDLAYVLFTSGTTNIPKGVKITFQNLDSLVNAIAGSFMNINETDKCLQMFDLTFDFSVASFLVPLLNSACQFTVPKNKIKYLYVADLMNNHRLSVVMLVPSILNYLKPYYDEIDLSGLKFCLFCGEALYLDQVKALYPYSPNATIINAYGPTEATVFCSLYVVPKEGEIKSQKGIVSIGTPVNGTSFRLLHVGHEIANTNKGELLISGNQLSPGYFNDEAKTQEFFDAEDKTIRYKSGDLCAVDAQGDYYYLERLDFQSKIQGFRVELSEIEFHASTILSAKKRIIAVPLAQINLNQGIGLIIEGEPFETTTLIQNLRQVLPSYMLPTRFWFVDAFPLTPNGKVDRKYLTKSIEEGAR